MIHMQAAIFSLEQGNKRKQRVQTASLYYVAPDAHESTYYTLFV